MTHSGRQRSASFSISSVTSLASNVAVLDLEGLPPQLDELEKIYLWGLQVYGADPSEYLRATAGFGPEGDREGWQLFLCNASRVLESMETSLSSTGTNTSG